MNDNLIAHFEAQDTGFAHFSLHCFSDGDHPTSRVPTLAECRQVADQYKSDVLSCLDRKSLINLTTTHEEYWPLND